MTASDALFYTNEIRIWAGVVAAFAAIAAGIAGYAQIRLQAVVAIEKDTAFNLYKQASDERIAKASSDAASAQQKAAAFERETASLNLALEAEKLRRVKLQEQIAWRRLTPDQKNSLISNLKGSKFVVWVSTVEIDPEARLFHSEVLGALVEAGIEAHGFTGYKQAMGLSISNHPGEEYDALIRAFKAAGIPLRPKQVGSEGLNRLEIVIGTKPEPIIPQ